MLKGKIAGIAFGGFAGFCILSKGMSLVNNCVKYMADAAKWKAYYKYGGRDDKSGQVVVPPGYSSSVRDIGGGKELVVEDPKQMQPQNGENGDTRQKAVDDVLTDCVKDITKAIKKHLDKPGEASEGQTEASEEGVVTERDENGNPIAGRYPFGGGDTDGDDILCPEQFDTAPDQGTQMVRDSLENGVEEVDGEEEE